MNAVPAHEAAAAILRQAVKARSACMSAWSCGEPEHRVRTMLDEVEKLPMFGSDVEALIDALTASSHAKREGHAEGMREAAEIADQLGGNRVERGRSYADDKHGRSDALINAQRVRAQTIAAAIRAGMDKAAKVIDAEGESRMRQHKQAKAAKQKVEARDFQSMAIAHSQGAAAIRAKLAGGGE